jgi:hypothetical protein
MLKVVNYALGAEAQQWLALLAAPMEVMVAYQH